MLSCSQDKTSAHSGNEFTEKCGELEEGVSMSSDGKPSILLLGAHRWRRQPVVEMARTAGLEPVLLLYENEELPSALLHIVDPSRVLRQSHEKPFSAREISEMVMSKSDTWFVIGLDDYVCEFAAELSKYSTKRTMPPSAARETLHKHLLRRRWNKLCQNNPLLFPVPFRFLRFSDTSFQNKIGEEEDLALDQSRGLIVKPDALDASIGIHKAECWEQVDSAMASIRTELAALAEDAAPIGIDVAPAVIVEQRIPRSKRLHPGAEFSAEFFSVKAKRNDLSNHSLLGITQKYIHPETFVEVAHCFPSETFPQELVDTVQHVTASLLDELQVEFGISHWEFIVCEDGRLALVEAQLRPAGDRIMDLVFRATDRNPYHMLFSALVERGPFELPAFCARQKAAVFFPQPEYQASGKFSIIERTDSTASLAGRAYFVEPELEKDRLRWGGKVLWHSRLMSIVTEGETFEEAKRKCEAMLPLLQLHCQTESGKCEDIPLVLPI